MAVYPINGRGYGDRFASLLAEERLMALGPGAPVAGVYPQLSNLDIEQAFKPRTIRDRNSAMACLAGVWLYFDYLNESHAISQQLSASSASYWHSIMHRREPDSWNAKYWLERTGEHPIFPAISEFARSLIQGQALAESARFLTQHDWDPYQFVDLCEASRKDEVAMASVCRRIQLQEWRLLFDYCYRQAVGDTMTSETSYDV